jgi:hypothetical protein
MTTKTYLPLRRTLISERVTDYRTECGTNTDWPVRDTLVREHLRGRSVRWILTRGTCNGVPDSVETYRTLQAARAAWDATD